MDYTKYSDEELQHEWDLISFKHEQTIKTYFLQDGKDSEFTKILIKKSEDLKNQLDQINKEIGERE
jgi:hypothetical protein